MQAPEKNLAFDLLRVTESAALSAARWLGKGAKEDGDGAAVDAMRLAGVDAEEALTFASKRFCAEQKTQSGTQVQGPAPIEKQTVREN